jgi:hypothetical protein
LDQGSHWYAGADRNGYLDRAWIRCGLLRWRAVRHPRPMVRGFADPKRGWERLYVDHVLQADTGADLDFLVGSTGSEVARDPH